MATRLIRSRRLIAADPPRNADGHTDRRFAAVRRLPRRTVRVVRRVSRRA